MQHNIILNFTYQFILLHLSVLSLRWVSCSITCSYSFIIDSSGEQNLEIAGSISVSGNHDGMNLILGAVLNNSFSGLPCEGLISFTPSDPLTSTCHYQQLGTGEILVRPGDYRADFSSWVWTFGPILPFSKNLTGFKCIVHPYGAGFSYTAQINNMLIPRALQSITAEFESPSNNKVFDSQNITLNITLTNPTVGLHANIQIQFPSSSELLYDICADITDPVTISGNIDSYSCANNTIELFNSATNTLVNNYHTLKFIGLKNPPSAAIDYYKIRASAFSNATGADLRIETAAIFWTAPNPLELNESNAWLNMSVGYSVYHIQLVSLSPVLNNGDYITIELPPQYIDQTYLFDTVNSSQNFILIEIVHPKLRFLVTVDNQTDFSIYLTNLLIPELEPDWMEISTRTYIYAQNTYPMIHKTHELSTLHPVLVNTVTIKETATKTVGKASTYIFKLEPVGNLPSSVELVISFDAPAYIYTGSTCTTIGPATCSFIGNDNFTINNPYPTGYICCSFKEFEITGIINPNFTYPFSEIKFTMQVMDGSSLLEEWNQILRPKVGSTEYLPLHLSLPAAPFMLSPRTVTLSQVEFQLRNTDSAILANSKIIIKFPPELTFKGIPYIATHNFPFTPNITSSTYPWLEIEIDDLPINSLIHFGVGNILGPYKLGQTESFSISIAPMSASSGVQQFKLYLEAKVDITHRGVFSSFNVESSSHMTSELATYTFSFNTEDKELVLNDDSISFEIPNSIQCDHTSITGALGLSAPFLYKGRLLISEYYIVPGQSVAAGIDCQFTIQCYNPELTITTNNYVLQFWHFPDDWYLYKESGGSPLTINQMNNYLSDAVVTMSDYRPLVNNSFTFTLTRTASYNSLDLTQIIICVPDEMINTADSVEWIAGNINITPILSIVGQEILIEGISELEQSFTFKIVNIQNPPLSTDDIIFYTKTGSSGYDSEEGYTNILHISCDFPCQTCSFQIQTYYCLSCYPQNHPLFVGTNLTHRDIILYNYQCIHECPPKYFKNIPDLLCESCDVSCVNCRSRTKYDCTECLTSQVHFLDGQCGNCPLNSTFNSSSGYCQSTICSEGCVGCIGPGNDECISCNTDKGFYPLHDQPLKCLFLCNSDMELFEKDGICTPCDSKCAVCFGETDQECNKCLPPYILGDNRECRELDCSKYPNTYSINNKCEKCHQSCAGCDKLSSNCTACSPKYISLNKGQTQICLENCPQTYYPNIHVNICQPCPALCEKCARRETSSNEYDISPENFICIVCEENYYLNREQKCVSSSLCRSDEFANMEKRICEECSKICKGCEGNTEYDCTECNVSYVRTKRGNCILLKCNDLDEYLDILSGTCKKCDGVCIGCRGPGGKNCISCSSWSIGNPLGNGLIECKECSKVKGYMETRREITLEKECKEICGDGITIGDMYECDDGNLINGDGCSSLCKVEKGFRCSGGSQNTPHLCHDIQPPLLALNFAYLNIPYKFIFHATEQFTIINTTEDPKHYVNLTIKGAFPSYILHYDLQFYTLRDTQPYLTEEDYIYYDAITINMHMKSSIILNDVLKITFNSHKFTDRNNNNILPTEFSIKLLEYKYLSQNDKALTQSLGNTVQYSALGLLCLNILLSIFFASSMNIIFPLFNLIQLILFIPLLELELPENLRIFITEYLQFANFNFTFLYNPFHKWKMINLNEVNYNPLNDNFDRNGIKSRAFIVNYGGQLMFWTFIMFLYFPITILAKCCKIRKFIELKKSYEYGVLLSSFSEAFLDFSLLSFLNITQLEFKSKATWISSITGILGIIITFGFIVLLLNILSNIRGKQLGNKNNLQKFGSLYSDTSYIKLSDRVRIPQFYIIIFLLRRLLYTLLLVFTYKSPTAQQILNITIHALAFIYDMIARPYSLQTLIGVMVYIFDFVALVIFATLPLYFKPNVNADTIGLVHIYLIVITFALSWLVIITKILFQIYQKFYPKKEIPVLNLPKPRRAIRQLRLGELNRGPRDNNNSKLMKQRMAQERIKEAGRKELKARERKQSTQRQAEWRKLQRANNEEDAKARQKFNGSVPLYVEIRRQERIKAHRQKWGTNI